MLTPKVIDRLIGYVDDGVSGSIPLYFVKVKKLFNDRLNERSCIFAFSIIFLGME